MSEEQTEYGKPISREEALEVSRGILRKAETERTEAEDIHPDTKRLDYLLEDAEVIYDPDRGLMVLSLGFDSISAETDSDDPREIIDKALEWVEGR